MSARTVLVTGAARGIGAGVARVLAREGWRVCVNYLQSRERAEALAEEIGGLALQGDMSREEDILRVFATLDREWGRLDGLVNNAGIITSVGRLDTFSYADIHRMFEVNSVGPLFCTREAVRRMSTRHGGEGGAIVNVASAATTIGSPGEFIHYAASKAALDALTLGLSKEVALEGIRVNAVSPGLIESDIHYEGRVEKLTPMVPMQRVGTAEEVGEAVAFLMSDRAAYVTGAFIRVSGGR